MNPVVLYRPASDDYFRAMGVRLLLALAGTYGVSSYLASPNALRAE